MILRLIMLPNTIPTYYTIYHHTSSIHHVYLILITTIFVIQHTYNYTRWNQQEQTNTNDNTWSLWEAFCVQLHTDPELVGINNPIPLLQIFAQHYQLDIIVPSRSPVHSQTVEGALRAIGQVLSTLMADMLLLGFYFLLCPGEHAHTQNPDACPFCI